MSVDKASRTRPFFLYGAAADYLKFKTRNQKGEIYVASSWDEVLPLIRQDRITIEELYVFDYTNGNVSNFTHEVRAVIKNEMNRQDSLSSSPVLSEVELDTMVVDTIAETFRRSAPL